MIQIVQYRLRSVRNSDNWEKQERMQAGIFESARSRRNSREVLQQNLNLVILVPSEVASFTSFFPGVLHK